MELDEVRLGGETTAYWPKGRRVGGRFQMRFRWGCGAVAAITNIIFATAAIADGPLEKSSKCELRVIPSTQFMVVDATSPNMSGVIPAIIGDAYKINNPEQIKGMLSAALPRDKQAGLISDIGLQKYARFANFDVVFDATYSLPQTVSYDELKSKVMYAPRIGGLEKGCYSEMIIQNTFFYKTPMQKRLINVIIYREFRNGDKPSRVKMGNYGDSISGFPPKSGAMGESGMRAVWEAFANGIIRFASSR